MPDTEKIVKFLLDRGITAMKIYPFEDRNGFISTEEIERGVGWLRQIDKTAGKRMEILVDNWGFSDVPSAQRIIKACEPFNVIHIEDLCCRTLLSLMLNLPAKQQFLLHTAKLSQPATN